METPPNVAGRVEPLSKPDVRYIYLFRGTLKTHVHFYKCWVDMARSQGFDMHMLTAMTPQCHREESDLVHDYVNEYCHVLVGDTPQKAIRDHIRAACVAADGVVVHLKNVDIDVLVPVREAFPHRLRLLVEMEGDGVSELDFHLRHRWKWGYFSARRWMQDLLMTCARLIFSVLGLLKRSQRDLLAKADQAFVVTDDFREVLHARFPKLELREKVSVLPISFNQGTLTFSEAMRSEYRKSLGLEGRFVMIYIGSVLDSWQNAYRTLQIFQLCKQRLAQNAFMLLAVRKADHDIVQRFIEKLEIAAEDYRLTWVTHDEIPPFLSASDIGVALRHPHPMNTICTPGKVIDYLGCGLPVLITEAVNAIPELVKHRQWGAALKDMDDDNEVLEKLRPFVEANLNRRHEASAWVNQHYATEHSGREYGDALCRATIEVTRHLSA
jgi:hypothetical protein